MVFCCVIFCSNSLKRFMLLLLFWTVICDMYLFHFIVLLNPDFSCCKSFVSFSFDKVTIGTYGFVSFVSNSNQVGATIAGGSLLFPASLAVISAKTHFLDQIKINSTSQLINYMFRNLQKLLKCFSGITTSVLFLPTLSAS